MLNVSNLSISFDENQVLDGFNLDLQSGDIFALLGDSGSGVKQLQKELIRNGYKLPEHGADGDFGAETKTAVNAFLGKSDQSQRGVIDCDDLIALETLKYKNETAGETVKPEEETVTTDTTTVKPSPVKPEKEETQSESVPGKRGKLQKDVMNSSGKQQKKYCQILIRFEAGMLKSGMKKATNLRPLKTCYDNHNFPALGDGSRKVRKAYDLKTRRNIKKTEKF